MELYILTFLLLSLTHKASANSPCKNMLFKVRKNGQALQGFVFKTFQVRNEGDCRANCYMHAQRCLSYNFISTTCELNESDDVMHPENLIKKVGSVYSPAENTCKCSKNELCRFDFARNIYHCECNFYDPKASCSPSSSISPSTRLLTTIVTTNLLMTSPPTPRTSSAFQSTTTTRLLTSDATTNLLLTSPPIPLPSSMFQPSATTDTTNLLVTSTSTLASSSSSTSSVQATFQTSPSPSIPPTTKSSIPPTTASSTGCEINFPGASKSDYVFINKGLAKDLDEFTISFWLKVSTNYDKTTMIFSYIKDGDNSLSLAIKDDGVTEVKLNGGGKSVQSNLVRGTWLHFCITWESQNGAVKIYKNGGEQSAEWGMQKGEDVEKGGSMYLGQKHANNGFDESMVIYGSIADFHIWADHFDSSEVKAIYDANCGQTQSSVHGKGDALSWETVTNADFKGSATKNCQTTCSK